MRIVFDQAIYDMRNKGNIALLQVALNRIHRLWPDAALDVLTLSPLLLKLYCPVAQPIRPDGQENTLHRSRLESIYKNLPAQVLQMALEVREAYWRRNSTPEFLSAPQVPTNGSKALLETESEHQNLDSTPVEHKNFGVLNGADLLVASGAQYMSDACRDDALQVLDRFEAAIQRGIPTVMVGQGIGPMKDRDLFARSKTILPKIDLIFSRERTASLSLLTSLGVDPAHISITGDDAVEMVYASRTKTWGDGIGIGLRAANYTGVNLNHIDILRTVLQNSARLHKASLISVPISHSALELDDQVIRKVLDGYPRVSNDWRKFNSPQEMIKKVSRCRLVVTGAYHTAVFALAQGIPAIGLAKSEMYADKFLGLADIFGPGIQIVHLDDENLEQKLTETIEKVWETAEQVRPDLLNAARTQIEMGQAAYRRIFNLVSDKAGQTLPVHLLAP